MSNPTQTAWQETFADYVPRSRLAPFLNDWLATPDTMILNHHHITGHILQAVDSYNPETDVILLLASRLLHVPASSANCAIAQLRHDLQWPGRVPGG